MNHKINVRTASAAKDLMTKNRQLQYRNVVSLFLYDDFCFQDDIDIWLR